jgi:hypothetical protein
VTVAAEAIIVAIKDKKKLAPLGAPSKMGGSHVTCCVAFLLRLRLLETYRSKRETSCSWKAIIPVDLQVPVDLPVLTT